MSGVVDCPMIMRAPGAGGFVRVNAAFRQAVGFNLEELARRPFLDWIKSEDHAAVCSMLGGATESCCANHRTRDGQWLLLELRSSAQGAAQVLLGRSEVATRPPAVDQHSPNSGGVQGDLDTIIGILEEQNPGYKCSILLLVDGRLAQGVAPSLSDEYNAAIGGHGIGPTAGSCGTAIYWNIPVITEDIQADPLWKQFAQLAKEAGVAACWSQPFEGSDGTVLGALALYSPVPGAPTTEQLSRLKAAARMTGLVVERGRAQEVSRRKRERELELEEQLRQAAKMEALGVLAGGVAHDFNNVLGGILANAELALDLLVSEGVVAEMLEEIVATSVQAGGVCKQMLAYAGHGKLAVSPIELRALLLQLSTLVEATLPKNATLEYSLLEEAVFVEGDENQLLQVVMNLVTNAAEAIGEKQGRIVVSTNVTHYDRARLDHADQNAELPAGDYLCLTVTDDGEGMTGETLARAFDPYFTTKRIGLGLGLAAVRGIVRGHGGVLEIKTKVGEGTSITVALPRAAAGPNSDESAFDAPESLAAGRLILLAEDDEGVRSVLCRRLRHNGFEVIEAADGQEAIDVFRNDPSSFDCVLVDLNMPKRGGVEVCRELRALRPRVPVILMSGLNDYDQLERFEGTQAPQFLQKPVRKGDLLAAIHRAIA